MDRQALKTTSKTTAWIIGTLAAAGLGAAACATAPTQAVEQAARELDVAIEVDAATYAPEQYQAARDARAELDAELAAQGEKFGILRSYDRATTLAAEAQEAAQVAAEVARTERERVRTEIVQLIADARVAVEQAKVALETAPTGKGTEADLQAMRTDLDVVTSSLVDAEAALEIDGFAAARIKAESALRAAQSVQSAVEMARAQRVPRPRA